MKIPAIKIRFAGIVLAAGALLSLGGCASTDSDESLSPQGISGESDEMWNIHSRTLNNVFR